MGPLLTLILYCEEQNIAQEAKQNIITLDFTYSKQQNDI